MIFQALINIIFSVLDFIIGLLPDPTSLPDEMSDAFTQIASYLKKVNHYLPMETIFSIIGLIFAIETGLLLFTVFNWLYNKVRGSG